MNKRLNITLPEETILLMDKLTPKGTRSQLINEAVHFYLHQKGNIILKERLAIGAKARANRDQNLATEWFTLENEV